jgi:predicted nucleic acid-binding protein
MSVNLVDSCGWLEYFADGPNADFFDSAIEDTKNLIVPSLCIAEVFKVLLREKNEDIALLAISAMRKGEIIDIGYNLALEAAKVGITHNLPLADSVIYATAKAKNALIWTQDSHFENLSGVKYISKQ